MSRRSPERIPRHRKQAVTWDSAPEARRRLLDSDWCGFCKKCSLKSKVDAHSYIGLLISQPRHHPRRNESTLAPYKCPRGNGWHVGRNIETARKLAEKKP
jgi:hypothetical protein